MRYKKIALYTAILAVTTVWGENNKLYDVKSGEVTYTIRGEGNVMGMHIKTEGTKQLVFDRYGARSYTHERSKTVQSGMGGAQTKQKDEATLIRDGKIYVIDYIKKRVIAAEGTAAAIYMAGSGEEDLMRVSKTMLQRMGAVRSGEANVAGYRCEVWKMPAMELCIYRGVTLRARSNIMGVVHTEEARKAIFNKAVDTHLFSLPDFPVSHPYAQMQVDAKGGGDMQAAAAAMAAAMAEGMQDGNAGAMPMGGADVMLQEIKAENEKEYTRLRRLRICLEEADDRTDVVECARALDEEDTNEIPAVWNENVKQQTLRDIDEILSQMVCIKNARDMGSLRQCMQ
jgi:hypothetical protein